MKTRINSPLGPLSPLDGRLLVQSGKSRINIELAALHILQGHPVAYFSDSVERECRFWWEVYAIVNQFRSTPGDIR